MRPSHVFLPFILILRVQLIYPFLPFSLGPFQLRLCSRCNAVVPVFFMFYIKDPGGFYACLPTCFPVRQVASNIRSSTKSPVDISS